MKVCHLSTLHYRYDFRIFVKQSGRLSRNAYELHYLVADGLGDELKSGIYIHDVGLRPALWKRINSFQRLFFKKALQIDAQVYHFHDPELIRLGLWLKMRGKKVIMDVHEDVPRQIRGKNPSLRNWGLARLIESLEKYSAPRFDAVVTASPVVQKRFESYGGQVENICSFPDLKDFPSVLTDKKYDLVYVGGISSTRGIRETLKAIEGRPVSYALAGDFQGAGFEDALKRLPAWRENTTYLGFIEDPKAIARLLAQSRIGMNNVLPNPNLATTISVKMFEYMAAGIPQIATRFPFWQEFVEGRRCGFCIDATDKDQLWKTIRILIDHPQVAEEMGVNGRRAVETLYNWQEEGKKLLKLYESL